MLSIDCFSVLTYDRYPADQEYDYEKIIGGLNDEYDITVCIAGENISYDAYSKIAENIVHVIHKNLGLSPRFTQLIYYRSPADDADLKTADVVYNGLIMQYESRIEKYALSLDIENTQDMHFFVELDSSQETKAKVYNYFQTFYIIFVGVVVIALSALWSVRKFKKWNRIIKSERLISAETNETDTVDADEKDAD